VGEYIQVEVRLPVRRLKLVVEYPAQDTSPDLPSDRLEEPALAGEKNPRSLLPTASTPTVSDSAVSGMLASAASPDLRRRASVP